MGTGSRSRRAGATLSYRRAFFTRERYVLKESALEVSYLSPFETNRYSIDLETLDPRWSRYRFLSARWLAGAVLLALAAAVILLGPSLSPWTGLLLTGALGGALLCAIQTSLRSRNCVTFHRFDDSAPVVNLSWHRPDAESFDRFVDLLQARIERTREGLEDSSFAAELKGLDRLRREGRLSDQEFRAAKATLLGMEPWQLED